MNEMTSDIEIRIRHKILWHRDEEKKLQAALNALTATPDPEAEDRETSPQKAQPPANETRAPKPPAKRTGGTGLASAIRSAVAKLKTATTREVTDYMKKNGFEKLTSSTASAMLHEMRKRGEATKDEQMRWHYTGSSIR